MASYDVVWFRGRTYHLGKMKGLFEAPEGRCKFVEAFEKEDVETRSSTEPSTFTTIVHWGKNKLGKKVQTRVFVKMIYVDPARVAIPKSFLNELYIMNTVVSDIIRYERSPHFVIPIAQVYGNKRVSDILTLESHLKENLEHVCKPEDGKFGIYNVMEHQDLNETYFTIQELVNINDMDRDNYMMILKTTLFQVFYNLTLMENLRFRHGDLHLENVIGMFIRNVTGVRAYYSPDPKKFIKINMRILTSFINFERSSIDGSGYKTAELSDEELSLFPCVAGDKMNTVPYGLREGCHSWNPYADWTRFMVDFIHHLKRAKGDTLAKEIMSELFPSKSLYGNMMAVLQDIDKYRFGRQSLQELTETVPQKVLSKATPGNIFMEYVSQFKREAPWVQDIRSSQDGIHEFPVFKAY